VLIEASPLPPPKEGEKPLPRTPSERGTGLARREKIHDGEGAYP